MYKFLHLHSDLKFIHDSLKFEEERIQSTLVFIGENSINAENKLNLMGITNLVLPENEDSLQSILHLSQSFDAVVIFGMNSFHEKILNLLPTTQPKFLRFFGVELYRLIPDKFLSRKTMKYYYPIPYVKRHTHLYVKKMVLRYLKKEFAIDREKQKETYSKWNGIFMLNEQEYNQLSTYFCLPPFLQLPLYAGEDKVKIDSPKSSEIIFGNSRHMWNNHLDILKILKSIPSAVLPEIRCFFNYGEENPYTRKVRMEAKKMEKIQLIEDFVPLDEFEDTYKKASALVINSYRQHALGNIFSALFSGCKVYLNKKSSTYDWLKANNFKIFEIQDLKKDILHNNYSLSMEDRAYNVEKYFELKTKNPQILFLEKLISIIEKKQ